MTRPTILDSENVALLDLTPSGRAKPAWAAAAEKVVAQQTASLTASVMRHAAGDDPTAWDDVRKDVEGLENNWTDDDRARAWRESFDSMHQRTMVAERQLSEIAGHMDSECDSDSILHVVREAEADRDIYKDRASAAEARIAELEKRLADAERVIERVPPYLADMYRAICNGNEMAASGFAEKDNLVGLARAYMEGK